MSDDDPTMRLDTVAQALEVVRRGGLVIVVDDVDRENEGDLVGAAERMTPQTINFMEREGRGLMCAPLTRARIQELAIPVISHAKRSKFACTYALPVDAVDGVSTGISASDRAVTVCALADPTKTADDFVHGGHIQPIVGVPGGVLVRSGHTEAALDLARLAGCQEAAVLCEIKREDGEMMRLAELREFADRHDLPLISVADLIDHRRRTELLVRRVAVAEMPTEVGVFTAYAYESVVDGLPFLALVKGELSPDEPTLVRVHSECLTGDALLSVRCDCGRQLRVALERIEAEGRGVVLYVRQEGRGIGLLNKLRAYALQDQGLDTVEANLHLGFAADLRDYGLGAQVLLDLGVRQMRLMTNNIRKIVGLEGYGLEVVERVPLLTEVTAENHRYLEAKRVKMGHLLPADSRPKEA